MKTPLLLLTLFAGKAAMAQVSYRTVSTSSAQASSSNRKVYDSTVAFTDIRCGYEPSTLIGQYLYFAIQNPGYTGSRGSDTLHYNFISNKQTPVNGLLEGKSKKLVESGFGVVYYNDASQNLRQEEMTLQKDFKTFIYKPTLNVSGINNINPGTPWSALENKTFKIIGWKDESSAGRSGCIQQIILEDQAGEQITWTSDARFIARWAVYFKSQLENIKAGWLNKKLYFRNEAWVRTSFYNMLDKQTLDYQKEKKWTCTEITFLLDSKMPYGKLCLILTDENKKEIAVSADYLQDGDGNMLNLGDLWSESKYLAVKKAAQKAEEEWIARKRAENQQIQKEYKERRDAMIKKYGPAVGDMIANGRVKLGMTAEQCELSWGSPDRMRSAQTTRASIELWFYNGGSWLEFVNGKLTQITN